MFNESFLIKVNIICICFVQHNGRYKTFNKYWYIKNIWPRNCLLIELENSERNKVISTFQVFFWTSLTKLNKHLNAFLMQDFCKTSV